MLIPFMKKHQVSSVYLLSYKKPGYFFPNIHEFKNKLLDFLKIALKNKFFVAFDCCFVSILTHSNRCGANRRFRAFDPDGSESPCSFTQFLGNNDCPILKKALSPKSNN